VRKLVFLLAMVLFMTPMAFGQFFDTDGIMSLEWNPPSDPGNGVDHYFGGYYINGVADSILFNTSAEFDSSVVLATLGDSVQAWIRAVEVEVGGVADTSDTEFSDWAFYSTGTGIGPPTFVRWGETLPLRPPPTPATD
jgi:hypothetical protein